MLTIATLSVLFVIFLICYTLCERNREINIQAIVEEHYERYMDQEEEYEREHANMAMMIMALVVLIQIC